MPVDPGQDREPKSANVLLQALLRGRISRRVVIERALSLGLSLPVVGVLLHATGDAPVRAAGRLVGATKPTKPRTKAIKGGTLNVGVVGVIDSLNPYLTNLYGPSFDILSGVIEGLLTFDSNQALRPALAESYEISDDGVVYTFKLRQGVTFHNGDELTSEDVIETWKMVANEDFPAWQRLGWEKIDTIDTPDAATLVITTKEIYAPFLSNLSAGAFNNAVITPKSLLSRGPGRFVRDSADPIGTGPMRFKERRGNQIVLERFGDYWGDRAKLEQIVVNVYESYGAQLEALRVGEIDLVAHTGMPGASLMPDTLAIDGISVFEYPGLTWAHLDLKQIGFLRETEVRQALDYSTPTGRIIDEVLGGEAIRAVADQSPGSWVFDTEMRPRSYNLERAAKLLDDVGLELNGQGVRERDGEIFRIELWGESSDPQAPAILNLIAESWREVGIETAVKLEKRTILWGPTGYQFSDRMTAGYYRWSNVNDPDNMFYWHSSQIPTSPGGPGGNIPAFFNQYGFQDKIDDLTSRAAAETDLEERKKLYGEIQRLLQKEVPVIFLFWDKNYSAASGKIGGYWPSAFNYLLWNAGEWYLTE
jgi:peptide/nickel transport system substrate-binding protein